MSQVDSIRKVRRPTIEQQYGYLTVTGEPIRCTTPSDAKPRWRVTVRCRCGKESFILCLSLRNGDSTSCGCKNQERWRAYVTSHGLSRSKIYSVFQSMKQRCYYQASTKYHLYGGRGILICDEWLNDFTAFVRWAMANGWNDKLEVDRIDNDGPYSPENCRLATRGEQCRNKRDNVFFEMFGERKCAADWGDDPRCAVSRSTFESRLQYGWSFEEAFLVPLDVSRPSRPSRARQRPS